MPSRIYTISPADYTRLVEAQLASCYARDILWQESVGPPEDSAAFVREVIFVICNSGMKAQIAREIYGRVMASLCGLEDRPLKKVFGHVGKVAAIQQVWDQQEDLFARYRAAPDQLAFLEGLPWIGDITKYHLAKNFGQDVAKPDVHLVRLADHQETTPQALCAHLGGSYGHHKPVATADLVLWRACNLGIIDSRRMLWTHPAGPGYIIPTPPVQPDMLKETLER